MQRPLVPLLLVTATPLVLLGGALLFQFFGHLYPCEMCIWQRWPHGIAIGIAAIGWVMRQRGMFKLEYWAVLFSAMAIILSGLIGGFHAGVEYGWWQGLTTCSVVGGAGNVGDITASVLAAPIVRCDQTPWSLFGVSLAGYNALMSIFAGLFALWINREGKRS